MVIMVISHTRGEIENQPPVCDIICKKYIAKEVTSLINLKFSPKLVFRNDQSITKISNLEKLLNSEKVLKDLKRN